MNTRHPHGLATLGILCAALSFLGCGEDADAVRDAGQSGGSDARALDTGTTPRDATDAAAIIDGFTPADAPAIVDGPSPDDAGVAADTGAPADAQWPFCPVTEDATQTATLRLTADDYLSIWFNGVLVAEPTSLWPTLKQYDVNVFLFPGRPNVIAVEVRNAFEQDGLDRGFVAELAYTAGGKTFFVNSDPTWKVSPTNPDGWIALGFNDSGWANAVSLGKVGIAPWNSVSFNSDAEWLWSYVPNGTAVAKADNEKIFLRKTFFMNEGGVASTEPGRCRPLADAGSADASR